MTAPENESGEWTQPDPADVAAYDARMSAYAAQKPHGSKSGPRRPAKERKWPSRRGPRRPSSRRSPSSSGRHDGEMEAGR